MFVKSLETTYWDGDGHQSIVTETPSWDNVVEAVGSLDGEKTDGVLLNGPSGRYMGIVGGATDKYVVAGIGQDDQPFILVDGKHAGKWIALNVGGQENQYADNEIVKMETALKVARTFFESGECDRRFQWKGKAAKMVKP